MKPFISYSLLAAAAACGMAFGQAYTTPVGYVSLGDTTPGQPAVKANTDVYISIPLARQTEFAGTVASVSGTTVTLSGSPALGALTAGEPYLASVASGSKSGVTGLITANTASSVTLTVQPGENLEGVAAGDTVKIQKAWTPKSLLGTTVPAGTQLFAFSGSFVGVNPQSDLIFEYDGTNWVDTNSFEIADNTALFQTETFVVRNQSDAPISQLVVTGEVTTVNHRATLAANAGTGQDNLVSYAGSVDEVIANSGLSAVAVAGDQVFVYNNSAAGFNKSASQIIEFDGTAWVDTDTFDDVSTTFKFQSGVGYTIRKSGSTGNDVIWSDQPNYVPSL